MENNKKDITADPRTDLKVESSGSVVFEKKEENIMGTAPCNALLLKLSIPLMVSMIVQAMYNIVDSIFVSRINENALTAVSLALPVQNLMIAVICGTGVGINARLSKKLGERKFESVNKTAGNAISITLIISALFMLFGIFCSEAFMYAMTDNEEIVRNGIDYIRIVTIFCIGLSFQVTFERLVQATGKTVYAMISQLTGAVANIILDPIFIFGWFGMPALGVKGAAIATVSGQIIGAMVGFYCNHRYNHEISLKLKYLRLEGVIVREIYAVGFPSIIMQSISSVLTFGLNKLLLAFSSTAAAVFGVYFKLQSFVFFPIFGLNNGLVPIIAYNYGARKPDRIKKTVKYASIYSICIMAAGFIVFLLMPDKLLSIFDASEEMLSIGRIALPVISICFVFAGYSIVCSSVFQALGHGMLSMNISMIRQLIMHLPAAYIFAKIGGLNAIWWAFPFADIVAFLISFVQLKRIVKTQVDTLR